MKLFIYYKDRSATYKIYGTWIPGHQLFQRGKTGTGTLQWLFQISGIKIFLDEVLEVMMGEIGEMLKVNIVRSNFFGLLKVLL